MKQMKKETTLGAEYLKIARDIADDLFTEGGTNRKASRLVLEFPNSKISGTGWSKGPLIDVMVRHLIEE